MSWQSKLKNDLFYYTDLCRKQEQEIKQLKVINALLIRLATAPPTLMIACEKIAESAAQLTTNANSVVEKVMRLK